MSTRREAPEVAEAHRRAMLRPDAWERSEYCLVKSMSLSSPRVARELLELTLRSFRLNMLRHLKVRRAFVNIDPVWGSEADGAAVRALCRLYFDDVVFREPETASFVCGGEVALVAGGDRLVPASRRRLVPDLAHRRRRGCRGEAADRRVGQISFWKSQSPQSVAARRLDAQVHDEPELPQQEGRARRGRATRSRASIRRSSFTTGGTRR